MLGSTQNIASEPLETHVQWYSRISHPVFWAGCLVIIISIIANVIMGQYGQIGSDSDDALRLVQIKDFLAGQSWFHTDQYRMGLAGGTDMHWSRIPDIPIILLTYIFDIFMTQDQALRAAISFWPPISAGIVMSALVMGAHFWRGDRTPQFTFFLSAIFALAFFRFSFGSIDHHNIQLGCYALAVAFALDPKARFKTYFASGLAAALSLAIGVEVYIFVAMICGFMALNWALLGRDVTRGTQGFGLGLGSGLLAAFVGTIAPSEYGLIYCDSLSLITLVAGFSGGLGLAALASIERRVSVLNGLKARGAALVGLGVFCVSLLAFQAPQCLTNPLDALPEEVITLWLAGISEAQSIVHPETDIAVNIFFMLGAPVTALCLILFDMKGRKRADIWGPYCLILMLLMAAIALTIYQVRFYPFAYVAAIIPLAGWIGRHFQAKYEGGDSLAYIGCLALSIPAVWALLPAIITDADSKAEALETTKASADLCLSDSVIAEFNALPKGRVSTNSNFTGDILLKTQHSALSGNYHRNWQGISNQIQIAISEPDKAYQILTQSGADYLYYCKNGFETKTYSAYNDSGLFAAIGAGQVPDYLQKLSSDELLDGSAIIFKVKP